MVFDQAQSPRLGQRTQVESTYVRMFSGVEIPEAAWPGQIIYRTDLQILQVYTEAGAWEDVVSGDPGVLTFVGPSIPTSVSIGDMWFDTDDHYKLYVARIAGANAIGVGAWELTQDSYAASQAAAAAQTAANTAQTTANSAVSAVNALDTLVTPDGNAPASSPTPTVIGSISSLSVKWTAITNHDPVLYEVHCSDTGPTFTCNSGTLQATTAATSYTIIEKLTSGTLLDKSGATTYYVRIIAKDADGSAAPGTAGSGALRLITNPDISADYIYANEINALQITGATLQADLAIAGKLKTAETGQRVELSSEGLKQFGPDGLTVRVDFPNDPAKNPFLDGVLIADALTLKNGMELRGVENIFAMGSKVILQTQTVASASAPSLTIDYPLSSLTYYQWVNPVQGFWANSSESSDRRITSFYATNIMYKGATKYTRPLVTRGDGTSVPDYYLYQSATAIVVGGAERLVTIGLDTTTSATYANDRYFYRTWDDNSMLADGSVAPVKKAELQDGTFSYFWQWRVGRCFSSSGAARAMQFCVAKRNVFTPWPNGTLELKVYSATDSAITSVLSRAAISDGFMAQDETLTGVSFGSSARMGFLGFDEDIWVIHGSVNNYVYKDGFTLTRQTYREFPAMDSVRTTAACGDLATNDFSRFTVVPLNDGPQVYNHTNLAFGSGDSPIWWGSFTWYDSVGTTHETPQSVRTQLTMKQRARLNVTVPELPDPAAGKGTVRAADDVNSFRFYLGRGASPPARTAMALQAAPANLAVQISYENVTWTIGTVPPLTTSFPAQSPATIESNALGTGSLPKIRLTGEGDAHFEALDVGGDGASSLTGKAFKQLYYSIRAQAQLTGGGVKTVDASFNLKWSLRFLASSMGRDADLATVGYFDITMPPATTVIPGYGGASSKTVVAAGIPLAGAEALWYELPYGSSNTSVAANFRVTSFTSSFVAPNNWVLLAFYNSDSARIEFATGENVEPGYSSDIYNIGGQKIKKFNIAQQIDTTDANGACTYTHGLGQTPSQVLVSKGSTGGPSMISNVDSFNSTSFRVVFRKSSDGTVQAAGISVGVFFLAIAE